VITSATYLILDPKRSQEYDVEWDGMEWFRKLRGGTGGEPNIKGIKETIREMI